MVPRPNWKEEVRALEDQNAQLVALLLASQRLARTLDLEAARATILDILVEFTGAAAASLWIQDGASGLLRPEASRGLESSSLHALQPGAGLLGSVVATGEPILEGETRQDLETGLPLLAAVPLRLEDRVIGAVALHQLLPQKPRLEDTDRELLQLIAGQAAAALASAQLYAESRTVIRGFQELGQQIASHVDDLERVLTTTVSSVATLVQAAVCQLFLVEEDTGDLILRATHGLAETSLGSALRPGAGIAGRALATGRVIRLEGSKSRKAGGVSPAALERGPAGAPLAFLLAVPLRAAGRAIGVLSVGRGRGSQGWSQDDELVLRTAADQLALGINNALLYTRVEDDYFKMSTLFMAANRLHATLDLEEILGSARDIMESLIGARSYSIILLDEVSKELRMAVAEGVAPVQRSTFTATLEEGFLAEVIRGGEPYVAPAGQPPAERLYDQPVLACIPLQVKGVAVGAIVVNRLLPQKAGLISHDNEMFAMLAQHAATAILAARLFARAEQRLVTLYDLSRLISASIPVEEILDLTMGLVNQVMRTRTTVIYSLEREEGVLRVTRAAGVKPGQLGEPIPLGEDVLGQVALSGRPLESENAGADARFPAGSFFRGPTLLLPLRVSSNALGVLAITDRLEAGPFSRDDHRLAATLAGQLSLILHHTSLYRQAQHLAILLEREREALRKANRDLGLANHELDALVEHMGEGVLLADTVGRVLRINPAGRRMLGLPAGQEMAELSELAALNAQSAEGHPLPPAEWPVSRATTGESVAGVEICIPSPGDKMSYLRMSAEPIRGHSGGVELAVAVYHDVTAQRELDRAKDELIATVSHELKNPLTALKGHAQLLIRQARVHGAGAVELRGLQVVNEQADRLIRLVDRLLDLSRAELGRIRLELAPVDLVALAERLTEEERLVSPGRPLEVVAPQERIEGRWDRARLEQVIANLLSNARRHTPSDTPVRLELGVEKGYASLVVRDRGPGIPPDQLERIFERYAQGAKASTRAGLGLGLYLSRKIVEAHGGRLWAESAPGHGAAFHMLLPLAP